MREKNSSAKEVIYDSSDLADIAIIEFATVSCTTPLGIASEGEKIF